MADDPRLNHLLSLQEADGEISFERWMRDALYHPDFGYYTHHIRTVGRQGDFSTWATLHENLGTTVASWLLENKPARKPWHIIEIGGGNGALAETVLGSLGWWWNKPRYHIVEISPVLKKQQRERLRKLRVSWHEDIRTALEACNGNALIFSNELVDAFPCRIFQLQSATWRELALRITTNGLQEVWVEGILPESTAFAEPWTEGQRIEVFESYQQWLSGWTPLWKTGAMLTVDYGDLCPALYHRRPAGTLRAYFQHQRLEGRDALNGYGKRDLTADVNFSDLVQWGEALGLKTESLGSLGDFLRDRQKEAGLGFGEAGEAFKVLVQRP